jgi:hypothetical protein
MSSTLHFVQFTLCECLGIKYVYRFEADARLNNIYESSSYLKENTKLHHYTDQMVNAV